MEECAALFGTTGGLRRFRAQNRDSVLYEGDPVDQIRVHRSIRRVNISRNGMKDFFVRPKLVKKSFTTYPWRSRDRQYAPVRTSFAITHSFLKVTRSYLHYGELFACALRNCNAIFHTTDSAIFCRLHEVLVGLASVPAFVQVDHIKRRPQS